MKINCLEPGIQCNANHEPTYYFTKISIMGFKNKDISVFENMKQNNLQIMGLEPLPSQVLKSKA